MNKKIAISFFVMLLTILFFNIIGVYAFSDFNLDKVNSIKAEDSIASADKAVSRIWGTVTLILQILAVAAIVIAGVRYMFASAEAKADIKKQTLTLVVGAILVFGASAIIGFIVNVTKEVTGDTTSRVVNADGTVSRSSDYDGDGYDDWEDIIGPNRILDIFEQDTNGNGISDYEDMWLIDHPEDKGLF